MRRRVRSSSRGHTDWNFAVSSARLPIHRQQSSLSQELISLFLYESLLEPIGYIPPAEYDERYYEQATVA